MSRDVPIGRLLVEAGVLKPAGLDVVRAAQQQRGGRFCSVALALGLATERALVRVLSRQVGTPGVVVAELAPEPEALALIPAELARRHAAAPARLYNRTLTVVMRDPGDRAALNDLQFHAGRTARPLVALAGPLAAALDRWYGDGASARDRVAPADASIELPPAAAALEFEAAPVAPLPADQLLPVDFGGRIEPADAQLVASLAPGAPAPASAPLEIDAAAPEDDGRPVVLAVDDEPSILKLYAGMLDPARYRLVTCARGDEAVQAVRRHRPHLVLLDALLPGMHGFEICRLVKSTDALADTQVVLLSAAYRGWQMKADLEARCGADDFFEKPFDVAALLRRIEELVGDARSGERRTRPLPTEALRHLNQGLLLLQQGDLDEAEGAFRRSIAADPLAARPHFYLGKILERRGQPYDAMYAYEQAVVLDASFFPAIKDLAILFQTHGFANKAVEAWQQALAVCPEEGMRAAIREHLVRLL